MDALRLADWLFNECHINGSGLFECRSPDHAVEMKALLETIMEYPFVCSIIREKELNVYKIIDKKKPD